MRSWLNRVPVLIAFASLVVICWQAFIYNDQRNLMNEQLKAMNDTLTETRKTADAAIRQADAAKETLEITKQGDIPVVHLGGWDLKPEITANKVLTASITLTNRGNSDITNSTNYMTIESRTNEPVENYQPHWKTVNNVTLQRGFGDRTFQVSATFSQSEVEQIQTERKFICVFGFLEYQNPLERKIRKRYCVKFGPITRECETWQNQEESSN